MTINAVDVTLLCMNIIGIVLFIGYAVFAYLVTHKGGFYQIRRWKFGLWVANILGLVLLAIFLFPSIRTILSNSSEQNTIDLIGLVISAILSALIYIIPFLFIIACGTHYQLKWWLTSDDFLDRLWKDPNKGHKSPVQDL
jgi:uncharacterized membrane protein YesL